MPASASRRARTVSAVEVAPPAAAAPAGRRLSGSIRTVAVVALTAIAIGVVAFLVDRPTAANGVTGLTLSGDVAAAPPKVGEAPPDFKVTTIDGRVVSLSDFKGKPIWLTFGASWCAQCRAEAPDLEAAYERYAPKGLVVLAVFQEDVTTAIEYAQRVGLTFILGVDPDTRIASRYDIVGIPTHVFIGRDGKVAAFRIGGLKPDEMDRFAREITG